MKSPMNMAPNKMKTPMKALSDLKDNLGTGENEIDPNSKFGKKIAAAGPPMKEPMKMKSPMKMGSAYKLDKSGFKMKSAPVNMRTPGSVAKMAGVSPAKHKPWAEAHKENAAHPNTAEAHGKQPKGTGTKPFTDGKDGAASRPENQA